MASLLERLLLLRDQPAEPHPGHWADALTVAYQQGLGWLQELRQEAETVAAQRRRLAVGADALPDPRVRTDARARDAVLADEERRLVAVRDALRAHLEDLRAERELILALPDPEDAARRARAALARWRAEPDRLVRRAQGVEPEGIVPDTDQPDTFEQPPGWGRS